jgi:ADP-ribose pyrophosphatase
MVVLSKNNIIISPWVSISERKVSRSECEVPEIYHSLVLADYVSVIAVDPRGLVPLVRQYRPALECFTLELPGGLVEKGETPEVAAIREFSEETGLLPKGQIKAFPPVVPDTGRLENRLWGFFVEAEIPRAEEPIKEPELELLFVSPSELRVMMLRGEFNHALHVALLGLAFLNGFLRTG